MPNPFVRGLAVGIVAGPAALVAALSLLTWRLRRRMSGGAGGGGLEPPPLPLDHWDYELKATDPEGDVFDFESCRGRTLVLNHWATWCAPCVAEMPSLQRLGAGVEDLDVQLACVTKEPRETVAAFVAERGFDLPVFSVEDLPDCFSSRAIPATFILDRHGSIVFRHFGAAAWDAPAVVAFVRKLAVAPEL